MCHLFLIFFFFGELQQTNPLHAGYTLPLFIDCLDANPLIMREATSSIVMEDINDTPYSNSFLDSTIQIDNNDGHIIDEPKSGM